MKRLIFTILIIFCGCAKADKEPDEQEPLVSPSGKYVLTLPIETGEGEYKNTPLWRITISDNSGKMLFKDTESIYIGTLSIYRTWDNEDRVWIYNSDDGRVWYYELSNQEWKINYWGFKKEKKTEKNIRPPNKLYPDYVK